jgi:anti-sigma regulatory factor (Ser/Thr protein kinase)
MQAGRATRVPLDTRRLDAGRPTVARCRVLRTARVSGCRIAGGKHGVRAATEYLGRCRFPRAPESVAMARETIRKALADWGLSALADDVVLCVSEAVTNSIQHARAPFRSVTLTGWYTGETVHVEVIDGDRHRPKRSVPPEAAVVPWPGQPRLRDRGRGIFLISQLSTRWGVARRPPGKRVWFEFDTEQAACEPVPAV